MDAFQVAKDDLNSSVEQLHDLVRTVILAGSLPEKKKCEMGARPVLREARSKLSALRAEARRTVDPALRAQYEAICKEMDENVRNLDNEMKNQIYPKATAPPRPKTFQEQRAEEMMGAGGADGTGFSSANQVLQAATNVQQDALESLQRTERLQNVTEESGKQTLTTLRKQTEQMYQIDEELRNLEGEIDHASRDVRWFYRQLAGDKCFLSLFGLCIIGLLVLMFATIWNKRKRRVTNAGVPVT